MSKSRRKAKYDRLARRVQEIISRDKIRCEKYEQAMSPEQKLLKDELNRQQTNQLRAVITLEYVSRMKHLAKAARESATWMRGFSSQLERVIEKDFRRTFGYLPGSHRTKRLTKKRATLMASAKIRRNALRRNYASV